MSLRLSRRSLLVGSASAAGLGLLGTRATPARATVPRPDIIACDTWGARAAASSISMVGPPTKITIHHTDSSNVTDYSRSAAHRIARQIQSWHLDGNGWADSGQQFTISRGGYVLEGRHRTLEGLDGGKKLFPQGAHTSGANHTALGIENEGRYSSELPPADQWDALVGLCAYLCQTYGLGVDAIDGHRDFSGNSTSCPGDALHARLPQLREDVASRLGAPGGGGGGDTRPWPLLKPGASGFRVTVAQHLLRHAGQDLTANGTYDSAMTPKVKAFQTSKGLTADGAIGRRTWESPLAVKVRDGDRGEAVRALQTALNQHGNSLTVDGVYGSGTRSALKEFQSSASLTADGVAGPDTWSRLLSS